MQITEEMIRKLAIEARDQLGAKASDENIKKVVQETLDALQNQDFTKVSDKTSGRIIVTAFGLNKPGIIFCISKVLADCQCNILDVSQKIMQDFFTLIMIVDIQTANCPFGTIKQNLDGESSRLGIRIIAQHEDVFRSMHRV